MKTNKCSKSLRQKHSRYIYVFSASLSVESMIAVIHSLIGVFNGFLPPAPTKPNKLLVTVRNQQVRPVNHTQLDIKILLQLCLTHTPF